MFLVEPFISFSQAWQAKIDHALNTDNKHVVLFLALIDRAYRLESNYIKTVLARDLFPKRDSGR
jgi:hypothetical protein